ncbi:MAG: hypothetical protein R2692_09570 [Microbacterium sp.]
MHELSAWDDPTDFAWTDGDGAGRALASGLFYELHLGTFTPEGTLDAAIGKLPHLVELGVTHVELLPVNGFNGTHNWGYDGVLWYTVQEDYGACGVSAIRGCRPRGRDRGDPGRRIQPSGPSRATTCPSTVRTCRRAAHDVGRERQPR